MFDATTEGLCCPVQPSEQPHAEIPIEAGEDCLILNIFKNNTDFTSKIPVMVYIHGGGFAFGSSCDIFLGPEGFMQKDVLLVTINYRLGVLGNLKFL